MKNHWAFFGDNSNKQKEAEVFAAYKAEIEQYIQTVGLHRFRASAKELEISAGSSSGSSYHRAATSSMSKFWTLFLVCNRLKVSRASSKISAAHTNRSRCSRSSPSRVTRSQKIRKWRARTTYLLGKTVPHSSIKGLRLPSKRRSRLHRKPKRNCSCLTWFWR